MRFPLTADERTYLDELWRRLRHATHQTNLASARWNKVNDELTSLAERSDWDDLATDRIKGVNLRLNGAYAGWNFWQQETRRLASAIQAERALRELMGLVDDDPTGLGYSREDDAPLGGPLPAGVEGHSFTGRTWRPADHPRFSVGEADARLDAADRPSGARSPDGAGNAVGAGDSSPAGRVVNERRTHRSGRPGVTQGAAAVGAAAAPGRAGTR